MCLISTKLGWKTNCSLFAVCRALSGICWIRFLEDAVGPRLKHVYLAALISCCRAVLCLHVSCRSVYACLSVYPTVGCPPRSCIASKQVNNYIIKLFSPSGSHARFSVPNLMVILRRDPLTGASNALVMKNRNFRPIFRFISEKIQHRVIIVLH